MTVPLSRSITIVKNNRIFSLINFALCLHSMKQNSLIVCVLHDLKDELRYFRFAEHAL